MSSQEKTHEVIYDKNKNHITFCSNGAYGGVMPDNAMFEINFYLESPVIPNYILYPVDDKGVIDFNKGDSISRGNSIRELQAKALMSKESALRLAEWIKQTVDPQRENGNE